MPFRTNSGGREHTAGNASSVRRRPEVRCRPSVTPCSSRRRTASRRSPRPRETGKRPGTLMSRTFGVLQLRRSREWSGQGEATFADDSLRRRSLRSRLPWHAHARRKRPRPLRTTSLLRLSLCTRCTRKPKRARKHPSCQRGMSRVLRQWWCPIKRARGMHMEPNVPNSLRISDRCRRC